MMNDFNTQTHEKAQGKCHILLIDGHSSHHTASLLQYAKDNNIDLLGYPPRCTNTLQGIDIACFAQLKDVFWEEINQLQ